MPCEVCQTARLSRNPDARGGPCVGGVSPWPVGSTILQSLAVARTPEKSVRRPVNGPGNPRPHPAAGHGRNVKTHPGTFDTFDFPLEVWQSGQFHYHIPM